MIDEHKDSKCRIFFCYRGEGSETAKHLKNSLKSVKDKNYGRIWYSDEENVGNYELDVPVLIGQAEIFVLFLAKGFTDYFLNEENKANIVAKGKNSPCVTAKEIIEIEKQRQIRNITVLTVNIDGYSLTQDDLNVFKTIFKEVGIWREDSESFYKSLNRNVYLRRQTDLSVFSNRLMNGLEEKSILFSENEVEIPQNSKGLSIVEEPEYRNYFQSLMKQAKYPIIKFFGYTGEVLSSDLLTYISRYSLNIEMRILQRNYVIEERDEAEHNSKLPEGIRPWKKTESIKRMCNEEWPYSLKRTIRYYSHQPILKGCLFCNSAGRAVIGFINFQKWEELPSAGGSVFKSVPSDMIMINPEENVHCEVLLERLNSQFEYEWKNSLSSTEMKEYRLNDSTEKRKKTPKVIIIDFDRTLIYLYKDTSLLLQLAKKICDYYDDFVEIDPEYYTIDGYHAWYKLHRLVNRKFDYEEAFEINNDAEKKVTEFEMEVMKKTEFFENISETLLKLKENKIDLMIVSSNSTKVIKSALKRENMESLFSNVFGRPIPFDPDLIKPSPEPIRKALSKTAATNDEVWYVGDDVVDVDSAKACGIVSVGVASGKYSMYDLKNRGADYVIDSFENIFSIL